EADNDTISNSGRSGWLNGGDGADKISNSGDNATVYGGNDDDNIGVNGDYAYVNGETGNDVISSQGINCTLIGGDGNDSIYSGYEANNSSISAGTGDDTISVYAGSNLSINGGTGNDFITLRGSTSCVVEYNAADGDDTVAGFSVNDTLNISGGSYSSQISDKDVIVYVETGSILLSGAANLSSVNIVGTVLTTPEPEPEPEPEPDPEPEPEPVDPSINIYTGGNKTISNYAGQAVTLGAFTGANFSGSNFVVNSSSGTLTIQNVTNKVVDLRDGRGNAFIKAYTPSAAGVIDWRGVSGYEIIYGSAAGTDVIFAGDGGSQLWGGSGYTADALVGGAGSDIFIGGRLQGSDNIFNASAADVVNLTDATLSDLVATAEINGNVLLGFNTGNIISIQSTNLLSARINFADGSSWRFNHITKSWQGA
ncbi:MAG: hypothetical protein IKP64_12415, partial [Selenomonadaceae bacterium]|nr:hypothetical protein [Selenomonadaceae bacterium]